jgi:hypothetical protein
MSFLQKILNAAELLKVQNQQYSETLLLEGTAVAGEETLLKTDVSNIGHFKVSFLSGKYETLRDAVSPLGVHHTVDDNVSHLRGQLIDGAGQRKLFNTFIPLDLFCSPGRVRSITAFNNLTAWIEGAGVVADAASPGNNLFYPFEFRYTFAANSTILLYVKNDSDADIALSIAFWGTRILSSAAVPGAVNR